MTLAPQDWIGAFSAALTQRDIPAVLALFQPDGYWRDLLAFTWNIKTLEGQAAIAEMLNASLATTAPSDWAITEIPKTEGDATTVWISFQTSTAHGVGRLTLKNGLCHTLLTATEDLKGHEEPRGNAGDSWRSLVQPRAASCSMTQSGTIICLIFPFRKSGQFSRQSARWAIGWKPMPRCSS